MKIQEKTLWFDSETGGKDHKTDALIQLAAVIEIDGEIVDEIDLKMQPIKGKKINHEAIAIHNMTLDQIKTFQVAHVAHTHFETFLSKYNKYPTKSSRYIMAGYNPQFDCDFVNQWYQDISGGPYAYWKHLQFAPIDVLPTLRAMRYYKIIDVPDVKLETVCNYFGVQIKAHDALSDIKATREVTKLLFGKLFKNCNKDVVKEMLLLPEEKALSVLQGPSS
jgi:DNA polymerase-3 subunit epsilon